MYVVPLLNQRTGTFHGFLNLPTIKPTNEQLTVIQTAFEVEDPGLQDTLIYYDDNFLDLKPCKCHPDLELPDQKGPVVHVSFVLPNAEQRNNGLLEPTTPTFATYSPTTLSTPASKDGQNFRCCHFCRSNRESMEFCRSHNSKDENGRVTCPVLFKFICPLCKATGENSHTLKFCPLNDSKAHQLPSPLEQYPHCRTATGLLYSRKY